MFSSFVDAYFYAPNIFMRVLSAILSPFALIYELVVRTKFALRKKEIDFGIPIISVGNLVLGGSGKSPLCKEIYRILELDKKRVFIVLRGYKRKSKGCIVVCENSQILCSCDESGDEAMDYGLNNCNCIVSEDRKEGILKAIQLGADVVILDDGFNKFDIKKLNILLRPAREPKSALCLPSGAYRTPKDFYKLADFIPCDDDIKKSTKITDENDKMVLVSGIANPWRLGEFYPKCVGHYHFGDHYDFGADELRRILDKHGAKSILCTSKDYAKIKDFGIPLSVINLKLELSENFRNILLKYCQRIKDEKSY